MEDDGDLLELAFADPRRAVELADARLTGRSPGAAQLDDAERCRLLRAKGVAHRELRESDTSARHLAEAVRLAAGLGDRHLEGMTTMSLAGTLTYQGDFDRAVALSERAVELLDGDDRVMALSQRATVIHRTGRISLALDAMGQALDAARDATDPTIEADLWTNRGILYGQVGEIERGRRDMEAARARFEEMGWTKRVLDCRHNLAWLAGRQGSLVEALAGFEQVRSAFADLGLDASAVFPDHCEVLVAAGLADEAQRQAARSALGFERAGDHVDAAEARLIAARAALVADHPEQALAAARRAAAAFADHARDGWSTEAETLVLEAQLRLGRADDDTQARAVAVAEELERAASHAAAAEARIVAAEIALALDRVEDAERGTADLDRSAVGLVARFRLDALRAGLHVRRHRTDDALRICQAAHDELSALAGALAGTEIRAHLALHVRRLTALGVALAVETGDVGLVGQWAERQRAFALAFPPVHPSDDPDLEADLNRLRFSLLELDERARAGQSTEELTDRCLHLQDQVRRRTRRPGPGAPVQSPDLGPLDALGPVAGPGATGAARVGGGHPHRGRASGGPDPWSTAPVVLFVEAGGRLHRLRLAGPDHEPAGRLETIGPVDELEREAELLRADLSFLLRARGRGQRRDPAELLSAAADLDRRLLRGIDPDGGPVLVCPTGGLYDLTWGLLPTLARVPFTVTPSLAVLDRCLHRPGPTDPTVLVAAGPGLTEAEAESRVVAGCYPGAIALTGARATVAAVKAGLPEADIAHLVSHGETAVDNPMFSSLRMADGPLFVHELERVRPTPAVTVLSACHAGLHALPAAGEILGLVVSLLAGGGRSIIAAGVPVPDIPDVVDAMAMVHRGLATGAGPGRALQRLRRVDPVLGGAFTCHGAG